MTLVDDVGSSTGRGKQFITMVTKNGNYFYVIIDRDDDGKENVHFLNQVDEEDLLRLMDEEEADAIRDELARQKITPTPVPTKVVEKPAATPEPVEKKKANLVPILAPAFLLAGGGAGYAYYRYRRKKQKRSTRMRTTGRMSSISMIHMAKRTRMSHMMRHERDRGGVSPPFRKEEHTDKAAYAALEDVSRLVRDIGDGEVIRIIFEEADDGEGYDS